MPTAPERFGFDNVDLLDTGRPQTANQPPTPNAATAAAQAFLKKQADDAGLSSAAAAAALRSHTASPASVGDTQTKRMVRRGSNSSFGSGTGSARPPFSSGLQRRGSNGSMTQRSFRSPSPGRSNPVPPVPALPDDIPPVPREMTPPLSTKSHTRTSSQEPASRPFSPTPRKGARASSLDNSQWATPRIKQTTVPGNLERVAEATKSRPHGDGGSPRESSRSINFSRPMSPPNSPQLSTPGSDVFTTGNSRSPAQPPSATSLGLSPEDYKRLHQQGKEERDARIEALRTGDWGTAGVENSIESSKYATQPTSATIAGNDTANTPKRRKKKASVESIDVPTTTVNPARTAAVRATPRPASISGPTPEQIRAFQTRAAAMLARPLTDSPSIPVRAPKSGALGRDGSRPRAVTSDMSAPSDPKAQNAHSRVASQPSLNAPGRTMSIGRAQSISPARSAHFLESPMLEVTQHQPLPRSASPVKPALKMSTSPRHTSPVGSHSRDAGDHSDARSLVSEDSNVPNSKKKKAVRVSFEETPILVGQAAEEYESPAAGPLSPQFKNSLRDAGALDDPAAHMTPRPVLPSFGSVRGRKGLEDDDHQVSEATADEPSTPPLMASHEQTSEETPEQQASNIMRDHGFNEQDDNTKTSNIARLGDEMMPSIAIQPATPLMEDKDDFSSQGLESPMVADDSTRSDLVPTSDTQKVMSQRTEKPDAIDAQEGVVEDVDMATTNERESDDSDVFSDAAEEPSELEDDGGFASLDAILESPQVESAPNVTSTSLGQTHSQNVEDVLGGPTAISSDTAVPAPTEDWSLVSAYWSSLSDQKKQQIEQEARKEPEEESPTMKSVPQEPKHELKKSLPSAVNQKAQPSAKPLKSAMKKSAAADNDKSRSDQIHLRKSMRGGDTMRPSNRDAPRSPPRRQPRPLSADVSLSPATEKAMAQRRARPTSEVLPGKVGTEPGFTRRGSDDSSASDSSFKRKRGNSISSTGSGKYSMRRSMREEKPPPMPSNRLASPPGSFRKSMRISARDSSDFGSPERGGSRQSTNFLGFGKSPKRPKSPKSPKSPQSLRSKAKKASATSNKAPRFSSRFDDSSEEETARPAFRSRLADSDESDDEVQNALKLAPVRGIPRKLGQDEGNSPDLSDSEREGVQEKVENRPPTPPTQNLLNMISAIKTSSEIPQEVKAEENAEPKTNGSVQGNALNAGTLRSHNNAKEDKASKRSSLFSIGKKRDTSTNDLTASKWAASDSAAPSTPPKFQTLRDTPKSPRSESGVATNRTWGFLRRSGGSAPTSTASSPAAHLAPAKTDEFPFPPPPIPEEYKSEYENANGERRPNTSDGSIGTKRRSRLDRDEKAQSASTDPTVGQESGEGAAGVEVPSNAKVVRVESGPHPSAGGKLQKQRTPVYSERTGRKKKFQGLRRVFGLYN